MAVAEGFETYSDQYLTCHLQLYLWKYISVVQHNYV